MNNYEALTKLAEDLKHFASKSQQHEHEHGKILQENAATLIDCFGGISNVIHTCLTSSSTAKAITNENFTISKDCLKLMVSTERAREEFKQKSESVKILIV